MTSEDFWTFCKPPSTAKRAEWDHDVMKLSPWKCPLDEGHIFSGKRLTDLNVLLRGKGVDDFVWTWYNECLITDRVLELFRSEGITGFEVKPVKARWKRKREDPVPRLWELVATGWAGVASPESGLRVVSRCPGCGYMEYSEIEHPEKFIDVSHWDGSDIFYVWPYYHWIFATERVARLIRAHKLRGVVLKRPAEEIRYLDERVPIRLSSICPTRVLPEDRAREVLRRLGVIS